ncbi:MAG: hypothetical protein ACLTYN_15065 [Dysosmobacter welbionis]
MEQTKGLSCQIPESLHARVTAERVAANHPSASTSRDYYQLL